MWILSHSLVAPLLTPYQDDAEEEQLTLSLCACVCAAAKPQCVKRKSSKNAMIENSTLTRATAFSLSLSLAVMTAYESIDRFLICILSTHLLSRQFRRKGNCPRSARLPLSLSLSLTAQLASSEIGPFAWWCARSIEQFPSACNTTQRPEQYSRRRRRLRNRQVQRGGML